MRDALRARSSAELQRLPRVNVSWAPAVRVVPPFDLIPQLEQFDPALQAAVLAELASVAPQLVGRVDLLPAAVLPTGPGASRLITAFTFSRPARFNGDDVAAFYGAESLTTAIAETVHHLKADLHRMRAPAQTLSRVALNVDVQASDVVDARESTYGALFDPDDYTESRVFGDAVRREAPGLIYRSVRRREGQCVAIYDIRTLSNCRENATLEYRYDGRDVVVAELHYP